uniref:PR-1 protein n=1 Tax=Moniliophthora perniciosa TaxID=153609 RepID=H6U755_MONPR|nr:PR-1 protein [Moniliophthora perniciosa]QVT77525.1 pathogenesis-related protein 1 [Moniliophthora perniciosa]QVT77526.1 pathogenesis-related protein 1 [Moniliophthora perniciosa]QVT77527.1 pathogenesis-related protein 1 [Moniliophthora perniciosa]QVT77530.1 pathogenesis-related protein 1 [Moniliophthora perniciosa]
MIARLSFILAIAFALSLLPEMGVGLALQARRHSNRAIHSSRSAHKRKRCEGVECWLEEFGFSKAIDVNSDHSHKHGNSHQDQDQDQYQYSQQDQYGGPDGPSNNDKKIYLQMHNKARAEHGAPPLEWDDRLAAAAQSWADGCVFEHSTGQLGDFGENLSAGGGNFGAEAAVQLWLDEIADHQSYGGDDGLLDHLTQVLWKGSRRMGCASRSGCTGIFGNQPTTLHVCEYDPPGNVIGQARQNVNL